MKNRKRVTLEPELELFVLAMTPWQRLDLAKKYERWARQLKVSASIMFRDSCPAGPAKKVKFLPPWKAVLN
jgi:hypothetical protein